MQSSSSTFSNVKYFMKKSFTILSDVDDDSMPERTNETLPTIINTKVKSVYHQNCTVPNENFSILRDSIGSKLQTTITIHQHHQNNTSSSYPSTEFFNRVSTRLKTLRVPHIADSETETDDDKISKRVIMEKPMFITTVRSGTFLEPPPEVAALLGLRKSYNNTVNSTTSSSEKSGNEHSMMYSYASRPRIVKAHYTPPRHSSMRNETRREKRDADDVDAKATKDNVEGSTLYGNTMYDRRVARGSNFASLRPNLTSTEHILSRQAEARRRAAVRQRAQNRARRLRMGTPPPVDGRKHEQIQTEKYWEEIIEKPPEKSIACQANLPIDSVSQSTISFPNSVVVGEDAGTQIDPGDLPDCDDEIHSVVTYIVNKILREAILEINEEYKKFRSYSYSEKMTRNGTSFFKKGISDANAVIVSREELSGLIEAAIEYLKNLDKPDTSLEYLEKIEHEELLEITIKKIRTIIRDIKFISEIIQTQVQNSLVSETGDQNSTSTVGKNVGEIGERNRSFPNEVVSIPISEGETKEEVKNFNTQETKAVIMDTDKTENSSAAYKDDDEVVENTSKLEKDRTVVQYNEKTEVYTTEEITKNIETKVTKSENFKNEDVSRIERANISTESQDLPERTTDTRVSSGKESSFEAESVGEELKSRTESELIKETEESHSMDNKIVTEVSPSKIEPREDSTNHTNSVSLVQNRGAPNSSTEQAKESNGSESKGQISRSMDNDAELAINTEGTLGDEPLSSSNQVDDNIAPDEGKVDPEDQIHMDMDEKARNRKKRQTDENISDTTGSTGKVNSISLEETTNDTLNNQNSTNKNQSFKIEESNEVQTQSDENLQLGSGSTLLENDIPPPDVEAKDKIQVEDGFDDTLEENSMSHQSTLLGKVDKIEENPPEQVISNQSDDIEMKEDQVLKDDLDETVDLSEQDKNQGSPPTQTSAEEGDRVSPREEVENENSVGQIESSTSTIEKSTSKEKTSQERPTLSKSSSEPIGSDHDSNIKEKKFSKTKSLESNSITNIIETADTTFSEEGNSNNDTKNNEDSGETDTVLQDEKINDPENTIDTQVNQEELINNATSVESDKLVATVEDQILPSATGDEEDLDTNKSFNQESDSHIQSVELEPSSSSALKETLDTTKAGTNEFMSEKSSQLEESVSKEIVQNTLEDVQSLESEETNQVEIGTNKDAKLTRHEGMEIDESQPDNLGGGVQSSDLEAHSSETSVEKGMVEDVDQSITAQNILTNKVINPDSKLDATTSENLDFHTTQNENASAEKDNNINTKTKQQSTNTDLDDTGDNDESEGEDDDNDEQGNNNDDDEDSDDMGIEGTQIIEETFTETTKTYKEISIRETKLVKSEFIEYTTDNDNLESAPNSNASSKMSSRESTASDTTKKEVLINIERQSSGTHDAARVSESSINNKQNTKNTPNQNGTATILTKEVE